MAEGKRSEKVADLIRKEVSDLLMTSVKDPRIGFVTVTRVVVSDDCRQAKVYFSVMGTAKEQQRAIQGLASATGFIRKELSRRVTLRYTPEILFQFDPSVEYAIHMEEIFHELEKERRKREGSD
jgi:ribosome-binding factor A